MNYFMRKDLNPQLFKNVIITNFSFQTRRFMLFLSHKTSTICFPDSYKNVESNKLFFSVFESFKIWTENCFPYYLLPIGII